MACLMEDPFDLPPEILGRIPLFAELQKLMSWQGGPVNWDLARQVAVSTVAADHATDRITPADAAEVAEDLRLAELWLTDSMGETAAAHIFEASAVTPVEWAEHATQWLPEVIDPVAGKIARTLSDQAGATADAAAPAMMSQALAQMAPVFSGLQAGGVIGALAREVTGAHEVGFPPMEHGPTLLVLPAIDRIAAANGLDRRSTRLWVAILAAASRLAFEGDWVRTRFYSLYLDFVSALDIDFSGGLAAIQNLDPTDPQAMQEALGDSGLFQPRLSDAAHASADRVGAFIAVIDAYAFAAAENATQRAGGMAPIAEVFARRIAEGNDGLRMLTGSIGLDPHERRPAARRFVQAILTAGGWELLNAMWSDLESFPSAPELDDPDLWTRRMM